MKRKAFTIIESLVACAIIAIMCAICWPSIEGGLQRTRQARFFEANVTNGKVPLVVDEITNRRDETKVVIKEPKTGYTWIYYERPGRERSFRLDQIVILVRDATFGLGHIEGDDGLFHLGTPTQKGLTVVALEESLNNPVRSLTIRFGEPGKTTDLKVRVSIGDTDFAEYQRLGLGTKVKFITVEGMDSRHLEVLTPSPGIDLLHSRLIILGNEGQDSVPPR